MCGVNYGAICDECSGSKMFIARRMGRRRRWTVGANVSFMTLLVYLLIGGLVLYSLATKVNL